MFSTATVMTSDRVEACVRRMIGARNTADYYLDGYRNIGHHICFAREAQRAYREADQCLQDWGVRENVVRQAIIHDVHECITGFNTVR